MACRNSDCIPYSYIMPFVRPKLSRLCAALACTTLIATASPAGADRDNIAGPTRWPVVVGYPEEITLTRFAGDGTWGQFFAYLTNNTGRERITLHEFSKLIRSERGIEHVITTGNNYSFELEKDVILQNLISGSGDKIELPVSFDWNGTALTSPANDREGRRINIVAASISVGDKYTSLTPINLATISEFIDEPDAYSRLQKTLTQLGFEKSPERKCSLDIYNPVLKLNSGSKSSNRNAIYTSKIDGRIGISECNHLVNSGVCFTAGFLSSWLPYTMTFPESLLCDADRLRSSAFEWLRSRIVTEARSNP